MDAEYLKDCVAKAAEKVDKCKATIKRNEVQLQKKLVILKNQGVTLDSMKEKFDAGSYELRSAILDYEGKLDDIDSATRKLRDATTILTNWQAKLDKEVEKERFIAGNAPKVIVEFLERWKKMAHEWHVKRHADFLKYKETLVKDELAACIAFVEETKLVYEQYLVKGKLPKDKRNWNFFHNYCNPRKPLDAYLKDQRLDWASIRQREKSFAGGVVMSMYDFSDEKERLAWLDKTLESEKKAKMLDLINRVNAVVGSIKDASLLKIDPKGNLNGFVTGPKGTAKVETIGAGGWNIQCFHYRTLVHKQNEKKAKA